MFIESMMDPEKQRQAQIMALRQQSGEPMAGTVAPTTAAMGAPTQPTATAQPAAPVGLTPEQVAARAYDPTADKAKIQRQQGYADTLRGMAPETLVSAGRISAVNPYNALANVFLQGLAGYEDYKTDQDIDAMGTRLEQAAAAEQAALDLETEKEAVAAQKAADAQAAKDLEEDLSKRYDKARDLKNDFESGKPVKDMGDIDAAMGQFMGAVETGEALPILLAIAKMRDPASVVREGEIYMSEEFAGFRQKLNNILARTADGKLDANMLDELTQEAGAYYDNAMSRFDGYKESYQGIADRNDIDARDVFTIQPAHRDWRDSYSDILGDRDGRQVTPPPAEDNITPPPGLESVWHMMSQEEKAEALRLGGGV